MPEPTKVDPHELARGADVVRDQADLLAAGHSSAISTAGAAQSGLVGRSAEAVAATMNRWQATTAELHRLLASQGDVLRSAAAAYAQTEDDNRDVIASLNAPNPLTF
ncbi:MAG: WXG100 family type VII secretion target [Mycobacterium sp.]